MSTPRLKAFTLIELLIVVAIIAILAAIAVPNFLEAQTRAKVSRSKADIRSIATALEAYAVDTNHFPFDITLSDGMTPGGGYYWYVSYRLTTPVSYMTSGLIYDTFRDKRTKLSHQYTRYRYVNYGLTQFNAAKLSPALIAPYNEGNEVYGKWRLCSAGPDGTAGPGSPAAVSITDPNWGYPNYPRVLVLYDPSNGTVSRGEIVRSQKMSEQVQTPYVP